MEKEEKRKDNLEMQQEAAKVVSLVFKLIIKSCK